jgi:hypothetical protein
MQMRALAVPVAVAAAGVLAATALSSASPVRSLPKGPAQTVKQSPGRPSSKAAGCPDNLLALPANPISPAVTAALLADQARNRPQVTAAAIASHDTTRGPQVKSECGPRVQARTVVVYITDRALLPSESASQRVLFVGRTGSGYRVWQRAH